MLEKQLSLVQFFTQLFTQLFTQQVRVMAILKRSLFIALSVSISACASVAADKVNSAANENDTGSGGVETQIQNVDKFEGFNRAIFSFNLKVDSWVLKPIAKSYRWAAPEPVEIGVSNFFSNVGEVSNILNDVLQWKWKQVGTDTSRLLLNSTVGLLGVFDVARSAGLAKSDGEDFGQTLAAWGIPAGPYLVLPFLGPSTIRDGLAAPVDWYYSDPLVLAEPQRLQNSLFALDIVQTRADLLDIEDLASGDMYSFFRDAYLQRREHLINDGVVEDDFGDDFFDDY